MTDIDHRGQMGELDYGRSLFLLEERQEPLTHPKTRAQVPSPLGRGSIKKYIHNL